MRAAQPPTQEHRSGQAVPDTSRKARATKRERPQGAQEPDQAGSGRRRRNSFSISIWLRTGRRRRQRQGSGSGERPIGRGQEEMPQGQQRRIRMSMNTADSGRVGGAGRSRGSSTNTLPEPFDLRKSRSRCSSLSARRLLLCRVREARTQLVEKRGHLASCVGSRGRQRERARGGEKRTKCFYCASAASCFLKEDYLFSQKMQGPWGFGSWDDGCPGKTAGLFFGWVDDLVCSSVGLSQRVFARYTGEARTRATVCWCGQHKVHTCVCPTAAVGEARLRAHPVITISTRPRFRICPRSSTSGDVKN